MGDTVISIACPNIKDGEILVKLNDLKEPTGIICPWYSVETANCNLSGEPCFYQGGWKPLPSVKDK